MSTRVYHQIGFREKWNFDTYIKYKVGDGFILSPVNLDKEKIEKIPSNLKKKSIFDPQCYFPSLTPKGKLLTYDYFPQNVISSKNCCTQDFQIDDNSEIIAEKCFEFQDKNDFEYLVIPFNKYLFTSPSVMIDKNQEKFVFPFIREYKDKATDKKLLLTIVLDEDHIKHEELRDYILNWITGIQEIEGVYLIFSTEGKSKQIKDSDFLLGALIFINELKQNGLKVIIGYTNTEALLYLVAMPDAVTIGSYENLRKFSSGRFVENDNMARAPIARLYSDVLLNWIPSGIITILRENSLDKYDELFDNNDERPYTMDNEFNWHFTKAELYKHYFISFTAQIKSFPKEEKDRIEYLTTLIEKALYQYRTLGIPFDSESGDEHLIIWKNVLDKYINYRKG